MTSKDTPASTEHIEQFALSCFGHVFSQLCFSTGNISRSASQTTVIYRGAEIAFEIELDWRDIDVFVLVVRLENGRIPGGYYVSNGRRVRVHLESVLKESMPSLPKEATKKRSAKTVAFLQERIRWYADVIAGSGPLIIEKAKEMFALDDQLPG